jgi:hypothetical protein
MPTTNTNKNSLTHAIGTVAMPALMANLGRIASVNRLDLDTMFTRNVREFQEERRERPSVVDQSLLFSDITIHLPTKSLSNWLSMYFSLFPFQFRTIGSARVAIRLRLRRRAIAFAGANDHSLFLNANLHAPIRAVLLRVGRVITERILVAQFFGDH